MPELERLRDSDALIINIDYPLGMAAYHVLAKISQYVTRMHGMYVIGKAATLNARVGDVMIAFPIGTPSAKVASATLAVEAGTFLGDESLEPAFAPRQHDYLSLAVTRYF